MSTWQKIVHFIQYDLWRRTSSELKDGKRVKRVGFGVLKTLILVVRGFSSKQLNTAANALTYNLVFAVVPILAMVLAIAKGFGFAEVIEQQLQKRDEHYAGDHGNGQPLSGDGSGRHVHRYRIAHPYLGGI